MTDAARPSRWQIARPAVSTRYLLGTGQAHGLSIAACLDGTGLRATDLDDPHAVVLPEQELRVVRNLLSGDADPRALGVETGLRYSLTSAGILGYALLSSHTIREALSVLARFTDLTSVFFDVTYRETIAGMLIEVNDGGVPADVRSFLLARDLVGASRVAGLFISPTVLRLVADLRQPIHVDLRDTVTPTEIAFGASMLNFFDIPIEIESGAHRTAFTIPRVLLDQPTPAPDPHVAAICIAQCEALLDQRHRFTGTAAQVRHILLRDPTAMPPLGAVARELGLSERTLHRRLSEDHTTFRDLRQSIRATLSDELLTQGLTVEMVARRLGYADTAAFSHAYHRWRGHPPSRRPGNRT